jgi:hypothetical protein
VIGPAQFTQVTQLPTFPDFLRKDVQADGNLHTYANGEIDYRIRGVHAKVSVLWKFAAPADAGDTHFSVLRGSNANLVIRQGPAEAWQPILYVEPATATLAADVASALADALDQVRATYPGVDVERTGGGWKVIVPASYHVGHEAHFGEVAEAFLACVEKGALPEWEVPGMIAKYHTTTRALAMARGDQRKPIS